MTARLDGLRGFYRGFGITIVREASEQTGLANDSFPSPLFNFPSTRVLKHSGVSAILMESDVLLERRLSVAWQLAVWLQFQRHLWMLSKLELCSKQE
jgi:hypothetical protein